MSELYDKLIFNLSKDHTRGVQLPDFDVPEKQVDNIIPADQIRKLSPKLPSVSEPDVMRHFISLSTKNHHIDSGFYPLGSCTMKYNPKINENLARIPRFLSAHPHYPDELNQGILRLMFELEEMLCEIAGMDSITSQPVAGAQGEFTALLMIREFHKKNGRNPNIIVIPDSAHGTNPASVIMAGYEVVQIKSNSEGKVDPKQLAEYCNDDLAAFMLTNPNTLGLFETEILKISEMVHNAGGLLYMDGANLNALLGISRPGDMGFDIVHFNLHKTFSTPHGGGGPGAGALGIKSILEPFLPSPVIRKSNDKYFLDHNRPESIGRVHSFYGNIGNLIRAFCYIKTMGANGLSEVSETAITNATYLREKLKDRFDLPFNSQTMHEFVLSGNRQKAKGVRTLDIAKRILDFGLHAPTVYFPLIVSEALMIEPTETESKASLDNFIQVMNLIADEVERNPEIVKTAPHNTPVSRLNEALAARELDISYEE